MSDRDKGYDRKGLIVHGHPRAPNSKRNEGTKEGEEGEEEDEGEEGEEGRGGNIRHKVVGYFNTVVTHTQNLL